MRNQSTVENICRKSRIICCNASLTWLRAVKRPWSDKDVTRMLHVGRDCLFFCRILYSVTFSFWHDIYLELKLISGRCTLTPSSDCTKVAPGLGAKSRTSSRKVAPRRCENTHCILSLYDMLAGTCGHLAFGRSKVTYTQTDWQTDGQTNYCLGASVVYKTKSQYKVLHISVFLIFPFSGVRGCPQLFHRLIW